MDGPIIPDKTLEEENALLWKVICEAAITLSAIEVLYPTDEAGKHIFALHDCWNYREFQQRERDKAKETK